MYRNCNIALVIPARNEERLIVPTLEGVPPLVDLVTVIDVGSTDRTADLVRGRAAQDPRVTLVRHEFN
ncbi:MAG: glycosyltransferase, partial [Planctomycetes bacterium]|nr:glycosyltransferase [Planctomycetota bacterium]